MPFHNLFPAHSFGSLLLHFIAFKLASSGRCLAYTSLLTFFYSQVRVGVATDRSAPQQLVVPDGGDGGSAEGSDPADQQHSVQTVATAHRNHCREAGDQLDVCLPLRLPQGQLLLCFSLCCSVKRKGKLQPAAFSLVSEQYWRHWPPVFSRRLLTQIVMSSAVLCVWRHHRRLFKQLSSCFWFCAGKRRPALVPDGERSHAADGEGAGGLCHRESSVHAQRGLAAVPGPWLQLPGTSAHTLFTPCSILHTWASLHNWNK